MSALNDVVSALRADTAGQLSPDELDALVHELLQISYGVAISHPLGFARIDISDSVPNRWDGEEFFVHVWRESRGPDWLGDIHSHIFALDSLVLQGSIENTIYSVDSSVAGDFDEVAEYAINYQDNGKIEYLKNAELSKARQEHWGQGDIYSVALGTVHSSRALASPTVTLIRKLFPVDVDDGPLVYGAPGAPESTGDRHVLPDSEAKRMVAESLPFAP